MTSFFYILFLKLLISYTTCSIICLGGEEMSVIVEMIKFVWDNLEKFVLIYTVIESIQAKQKKKSRKRHKRK